jgi:transposase
MESTMTLYIGIDFHPYQQTIAFCDDREGEIKYRQFLHSDKKALRHFYQSCQKDSIMGVEATGSLQWFEKMLFEMGLSLKIGNPRLIRRMALSRHKNDYRDAENILDLLLTKRFPEIQPRSPASRVILQTIALRHALVGQRTRLLNQLQAVARQKGLDKFRMQKQSALEIMLAGAENEPEQLLLKSRFEIMGELNRQIKALELELEKVLQLDEKAKLLQTHSGVGKLTALCLVHTLGDVKRFNNKEEVTSFVGLAPVEKSSGERKRMGQISKQGSKLLRFLLIEAAHKSKDTDLQEHYKRVCRRRGRPQAKVARGRKLLINCYVMLRDNKSYQEFSRHSEVGGHDDSRKVKGD